MLETKRTERDFFGEQHPNLRLAGRTTHARESVYGRFGTRKNVLLVLDSPGATPRIHTPAFSNW